MTDGAEKLLLYHLRPAAVVVLGLILEPGPKSASLQVGASTGSRWRVPRYSASTIERNLARSCRPTNVDLSAPLRLATLGVVPDSPSRGKHVGLWVFLGS